jgi:hypothetical protein
MHADATFTVSDPTPAPAPERVGDQPMVTTAASVGLAHMLKTFTDPDGTHRFALDYELG